MGKTIKLTEKEAEQIFWDDHEDYEIVREVEWIDDGKYDLGDVIFRKKGEDTTYSLGASRSGSYHTDYYVTYNDEAYEVIEVEVTRKEWQLVK